MPAFVAGIHIEDARASPAAKGNQSASVDDHIGRIVEQLRGTVEMNDERLATAIKHDGAALFYRGNECIRGTAFGGSCTDHVIGIRYILQACALGYGVGSVGVTGRGAQFGMCNRIVEFGVGVVFLAIG